MSCIHFKFKSSLEYDKFTFDGLQVSVAELKEGIMRQKKIGASNVFKLKIIDAQSKKEYENDSEVLPRNTSVIVHRVPIPNAAKLPKTQHKDPTLAPTQPVCEMQSSVVAMSQPSCLLEKTYHWTTVSSSIVTDAALLLLIESFSGVWVFAFHCNHKVSIYKAPPSAHGSMCLHYYIVFRAHPQTCMYMYCTLYVLEVHSWCL